jgi:predicted kinase
MAKRGKVHMVCGLTDAGKPTYSETLRRDLGGVRFSIDEWNDRLFLMDRDPTSNFEWFYERVQRCCAQMRDTAEQVINVGVPVVLDCGFTNRKERQIFYDWAEEQGLGVVLHFLDIPEDIRWQRVQQRNTEQGDTFVMDVTREMFDFMQTLWVAPNDEEMVLYDGQLVTD